MYEQYIPALISISIMIYFEESQLYDPLNVLDGL